MTEAIARFPLATDLIGDGSAPMMRRVLLALGIISILGTAPGEELLQRRRKRGINDNGSMPVVAHVPVHALGCTAGYIT